MIRYLLAILSAISIFPSQLLALPSSLIEFSAEVTRSDSSRPNSSSKGSMYVGKEGIRTESQQEEQPVWMIFKPNQKLVWTIFPKQQVYMERAGLAVEWPPLPEDETSPCRHKKFRCQKQGQKIIQERNTLHWSIHVLSDKGELPYGQLWVDPRLNIAIRESYADGLTVEMHHIREAPQPAHLFELPANFMKVDLPAPAASNKPKEK
ncbi:hypothetical protein [Candidatus Magnetaquicoccus inordinatus]|uniref:hypothetical protein n=1 Tax=Candidatus Magnetaquicoccus inordinatus TaxID=2496818 RepID=UPI00102C06CC|nr:hypothetical protein [Candidatus Magnetaquicoccus inordinatus]